MIQNIQTILNFSKKKNSNFLETQPHSRSQTYLDFLHKRQTEMIESEKSKHMSRLVRGKEEIKEQYYLNFTVKQIDFLIGKTAFLEFFIV